MSIRIKLELKDHCIETVAKRELKRLIVLYFEDDESTFEIVNRIEILQRFLNESDFPTLRSSDIRLSGDVESIVYISQDEDDGLSLFFE